MPTSTQAETICPACGGANNCALAAGHPAAACWCMRQALDPDLVERYRDSRRCLCALCGAISGPSAESSAGNHNEDSKT